MHNELVKTIAPVLISSLTDSESPISPTTFRRAKDTINSVDICGFTIINQPESLCVSAYVHRHLFQHTWFLCRLILPKESQWQSAKTECACKSQTRFCSHSVVLLILVSSIQSGTRPFSLTVVPLQRGHPLLLFSSMRETQLSWDEKMTIFCSRSNTPSERRRNLLDEKTVMTYQWAKTVAKRRRAQTPRVTTTSWSKALLKLDSVEPPIIAESNSEQTVDQDQDPPVEQLQADEVQMTTRRSTRKRTRPPRLSARR